MITVQEENVHVYRTTGTSDEQASILKELFLDSEFSKKNNHCYCIVLLIIVSIYVLLLFALLLILLLWML